MTKPLTIVEIATARPENPVESGDGSSSAAASSGSGGDGDPYGEGTSGAYGEGTSGAYGEGTSGAYGEGTSGAYGEGTSGAYGEGTSGAYGQNTSSAYAEDVSYQPRYPPKEERKVRNELAKLDLIPVPGIQKVTIRRDNNLMFVIAKPEVYKNPTSNSYVVYGEAELVDLAKQSNWQQLALASMLGQPLIAQNSSNTWKDPPPYDRPKAGVEINWSEYDSEEIRKQWGIKEPVGDPPSYDNRPVMNVVPEDGSIKYMSLNVGDVSIVCKQANVNEQMAIDALLKNDCDVVNAVLSLTERLEI